MKPITVRGPDCSVPGALRKEWLDTNGIGGYASGTVAGCHTRKYHGLLVADLAAPAGTFVLVSQAEDWLVGRGGRRQFLVTHEYPGTYHPHGHRRVHRFEAGLTPSFTFRCDAMWVTRRLLMPQGENTTLLRYELRGRCAEATICIRPLLAFRDVHCLTHENPHVDPGTEPLANGFSTRPYEGMPRLFIWTDLASDFTPEFLWYRDVLYERDARRGLEHREDLFTPGVLSVRLAPGGALMVAFSAEEPHEDLSETWRREEERRREQARAVDRMAPRRMRGGSRMLYRRLVRTSRQFLVRCRGVGPTVHAGYHWFAPWGRDTLIALPGVAFLTGLHDFGVDVLRSCASLEQRGLLPNFVKPDGTAVYTAADPSLWFFWTVQQYLKSGGLLETVHADFWPTMLSILSHYRAGTDNRIHTDASGLLRAGGPGTPVTWMDAQIGGRAVIPRWGYAVEICALWYNALCFSAELAERFGEPLAWLTDDFRESVREAFTDTFWLPGRQVLLDRANEYQVDDAVRVNQILAASLPYSVLTPEQQRSVVEVVHEELFTPYGLRSLTPEDIRYRPTCQGDQWLRDLGYHQGSVWPWLMAHFADAYIRVHGRGRGSLRLFEPVIDALGAHLLEHGLGSISEVFDGDPPHAARGAISQAWHVGECIRLLHVLYSPL